MHYHIVGIGGAGLSGIAHILLDQGHTVSGSDTRPGSLADAVQKRGVRVSIGHHAALVDGADAVLVTAALSADNPEVAAARARGIPVLKRTDLWREWSQQRRVIAVAGTHGKTTTSAMIALALDRAGMQPGFLVGGMLPGLGSNARWGASDAPLVIEADEYERAFLSLKPHIAVITNVELDHVDIYANAEDYEQAFRSFVDLVPEARNLIVCGDDLGAIRSSQHRLVTQYGIDNQIAANPASCRLAPLDWSAARLHSDAAQTRFEVWLYDRSSFATRLAGIQSLRVPGLHNVRNALAALATCAALGADARAVSAALADFEGAARRFELKGELHGITVIDDYGHHPSEVAATLAAARLRYPERRLLAYLQPHTYSRTQALLDEWSKAFEAAQAVFVGDIYAARETNTHGMSAKLLAERIGGQAVGNIPQAAAHITQLLQPGDVLITFGAGDSNQVAELVVQSLRDHKQGR